MTSSACHPCYPGSPSIGSGSFRQDRCIGLPHCRKGSTTPSCVSRLHLSSLTLQPAGLLDSLTEPLSGNSVLQVTLYTSLKLRGRTAELPRSSWPCFSSWTLLFWQLWNNTDCFFPFNWCAVIQFTCKGSVTVSAGDPSIAVLKLDDKVKIVIIIHVFIVS